MRDIRNQMTLLCNMYSIVMLLEGVDSFEPLLATSKGALAELPQSVKDICGSVASAPWCNAQGSTGFKM